MSDARLLLVLLDCRTPEQVQLGALSVKNATARSIGQQFRWREEVTLALGRGDQAALLRLHQRRLWEATQGWGFGFLCSVRTPWPLAEDDPLRGLALALHEAVTRTEPALTWTHTAWKVDEPADATQPGLLVLHGHLLPTQAAHGRTTLDVLQDELTFTAFSDALGMTLQARGLVWASYGMDPMTMDRRTLGTALRKHLAQDYAAVSAKLARTQQAWDLKQTLAEASGTERPQRARL